MIDKPRKAWIAGLLSFLTIGLGHIYSGEFKKGVLLFFCIQFISLVIFLPVIIFWTNIITILILFFLEISFFLYVLIDAIRVAKKNSASYSLKKYNRWYIYLLLFVFASFIFGPAEKMLIRKNIVQAFKIPSGAMIPTILVGDYLLANKYIYKFTDPQRGEVVIFIPPHEPSKAYVKRLIGIGGDTIEIKNKQLFINNVPQTESYIIHSDSKTLPSDISPRDNFGPVTVPENFLFFLGDNRDNSLDSRFWGFVSKDKVLGKAMKFYFSWDSEEKNVRWDRIGKGI